LPLMTYRRPILISSRGLSLSSPRIMRRLMEKKKIERTHWHELKRKHKRRLMVRVQIQVRV
jgi:hypothetical protein